jgi:N-acetylglucosamine-6-sulfatase
MGRRHRLRRDAARLGGALAALALLLALPCAAPAAIDRDEARGVSRPNVVVIMTDDQTVESMRVMDNVDRLLAAQGTTFDNSFVSFPLCCPSRATFLTGQYSHNNGVVGNNLNNGLSRLDQSNTLPVWLSRGGYTTVMVGKYLNEYGTLQPKVAEPGWTEWYAGVRLGYFDYTLNMRGRIVKFGEEPSAYQTDVLTSIALDVIQRRAARQKPFFLWLSYFAPHYGGPREADDPPGLKTPVAAPRHRGRFATEPLPQPPSFNEADVSDKPAQIRNRPLLGQGTIDALTSSYRQRLESLLAVDEGVAKVVAALRSAGVLDNTLIIFTSDNGFLQGEHRVADAKEQLYEPSIRVPLIVRGPGVPRNAHLGQLVANVDLAPTILDATRVPPGRVEDGRSLLPLLADPGLEWGRDIVLERGPAGNPNSLRLYTGIRTTRYLYAEYASGERELYDLARDPDELQSVHAVPAYDSVETELAGELASLRDCSGPACSQPPALQLEGAVARAGDCVRTVDVTGADEAHVVGVDWLADGRPSGSQSSRPFELPLGAAAAPGATAKLRAVATLDDGRRVSLDLDARACQM